MSPSVQVVDCDFSGINGSTVESQLSSHVMLSRTRLVPSVAYVLPIDLGNAGVSPNDEGDADTGPNAMQNFPTITLAELSDSGSTLTASLSSLPSIPVRIELFATGAHLSNFGHGHLDAYLGSASGMTDGTGLITVSVTPNRALVPGERITATATRTDTYDTSEAAANVVVVDARTHPADAGVDAGDASSPTDADIEDATAIGDASETNDASTNDAAPMDDGSLGDAATDFHGSGGCACTLVSGGHAHTPWTGLAFAFALVVSRLLRRQRKADRTDVLR